MDPFTTRPDSPKQTLKLGRIWSGISTDEFRQRSSPSPSQRKASSQRPSQVPNMVQLVGSPLGPELKILTQGYARGQNKNSQNISITVTQDHLAQSL